MNWVGRSCRVSKRISPGMPWFSSWWFFTNPSEKYAIVKLDHFPNVRDENKKYLKKPPNFCDTKTVWLFLSLSTGGNFGWKTPEISDEKVTKPSSNGWTNWFEDKRKKPLRISSHTNRLTKTTIFFDDIRYHGCITALGRAMTIKYHLVPALERYVIAFRWKPGQLSFTSETNLLKIRHRLTCSLSRVYPSPTTNEKWRIIRGALHKWDAHNSNYLKGFPHLNWCLPDDLSINRVHMVQQSERSRSHVTSRLLALNTIKPQTPTNQSNKTVKNKIRKAQHLHKCHNIHATSSKTRALSMAFLFCLAFLWSMTTIPSSEKAIRNTIDYLDVPGS